MDCQYRLILVVDDELPVACVAAAILESAGFQTRVAQSAEEAVEICAGLPEPPGLLLTDVVMPGVSGPELFLELADRFHVKRCLLTSGFPAECLGQLSGLEYQILPKPFEKQHLLAAVAKMLDAGNSRADALARDLRRRADPLAPVPMQPRLCRPPRT